MRHAGVREYQIHNENRIANEMRLQDLQKEVDEDHDARIRYESDARSSCRRKANKQKQADREYSVAKKIAKREQAQKDRRIEELESEAIALEVAKRKNDEIRDQKTRQGLRENTAELRELKSKLNMALISQTRDKQIQEQKMISEQQRAEQLMLDEEMMRRIHEEERIAQLEERAKQQAEYDQRIFIQKQLEDKARRRKLLEEAERVRDKELILEAQEKERKEYLEYLRMKKEKEQKYIADIEEFKRQREEVRQAERMREEEEKRKMDQYTMDVDERLARAQEEQKIRDALHQKVADKIGKEIVRQKKEAAEYEQMCIDLAMFEEMEKLKKREEEEAEKIRRQQKELQEFIKLDMIEKQKKAELSRQEEEELKRQMEEQQERVAKLSELEQEQNKIRIEKYRRALAKQLAQRKEMYEAARQEELRKIQMEQEREAARQRLIEEERQNLVVNHILMMGPEAVKYLPKGVLKEGDLELLPVQYRIAILESGHFHA